MFKPVRFEIAYNDDMEYFSRKLRKGLDGFNILDVGYPPGGMNQNIPDRLMTSTEAGKILKKMGNKNFSIITDEVYDKKYIEFEDENTYTEFMILK